MQTATNKGCLQKPKSQTYNRNKAFYQPHTRCPEKLEGWLLRQEAEIDRKYQGLSKTA